MRPLYASEKLLPGPPFMGCGLSSDWFGTMLATSNEAGRNAQAREKGQAGRRADLQRGWKAFSRQVPADSNGWVDQGDIELIHSAMFGKAVPQPLIGRIPLPDAWDAIGDYAVSMAIDTSAVPAGDPVRRFVGGVPHQVVEWRKRGTGAARETLHVCPMHPPSDAYQGHWVRWSSVTRCAKAIRGSEGQAFVVLYPVGDWTRARLATQALRRRNRALTTKVAEQKAATKAAKATTAAQRARADGLAQQLAACEAGGTHQPGQCIDVAIRHLQETRP